MRLGLPRSGERRNVDMDELDVELDDLLHRYTLNGLVVPGCTTVLSKVGAIKGFGFLKKEDREYYQSRGHAAHRSVELAICGTLDRRTLTAEIKSYLIGWERFCEDYGVEVLKYKDAPFVE